MFSWITSWWKNVPTGPARNIPIADIKVKEFFEQKPTSVILISQQEITDVRNQLKPTIINENPPIVIKAPLMKEFDDLFCDDGVSIFIKLKQRKNNVRTT